jgi:hypothetical protein
LPEVSPAPPTGAAGTVRFGPDLPSPDANRVPEAEGVAEADVATNGRAGSTEIAAEGSEERFAFFAAFRAAAEQAREEAGIDTRRVPR